MMRKLFLEMSKLTRRQAAALLFMLPLVSACGAKPKEADDTLTANIAGYNSTEDGIGQFFINGYGGGYGGVAVNAYGSGGFVCCIEYPRQWRPGLTAEVKWTTTSGLPGGDPAETWHEAIVPIEKYERGGTMNVHFLSGNNVRILIWNGSPGSEGYQGPDYPQAPAGWPPPPKAADEAGRVPLPVPRAPSSDQGKMR